MNKAQLSIIYLLIFIFYTGNSFSQESKTNVINIEADQLIATQDPLRSEFIGNVFANDHVNFFWGDKLTINYDENKKIELIELEKNVKLKRINEEVTGNFASYNPKTETIEVIGNVIVFKDKNVLYGEKLIIDLISSTSIITGKNEKQVSVKITQ